MAGQKKKQRRFEKILGLIIILMAALNLIRSYVVTNSLNQIINNQNITIPNEHIRTDLLTATTAASFLANILFVFAGYVIYTGKYIEGLKP